LKPSSYSQSIDINLAIEEHLPLVKRIAHQICSRLPPNVEVDDLIQEGLLELNHPLPHSAAAESRSDGQSVLPMANALQLPN